MRAPFRLPRGISLEVGGRPGVRAAVLAAGVYVLASFLLALAAAALLSAGGRGPEDGLRLASAVVGFLAGIPAGAAGAWGAVHGGVDDRRAAVTAAVLGPPILTAGMAATSLIAGDPGGAAWGALVCAAALGGSGAGAYWVGRRFDYVTIDGAA